MGYKYYDTPKGEDIVKKLWVTTKIAGSAGLMWSTIDVMLYSKPIGYLQTIGRYAYITGPFVGIAAAFAIASNVSASIRKKDDSLNYVIGGIAAGNMVGAWRKSIMVGFCASVAFAVAGIVKKSSIDDDWAFLQPINRQVSGVNTRWWDFTLTRERPRNWTTGKE